MIFGTGCYPEPQTSSHYQLDHIALASWSPFDWNKGYDIEEELGFLLPVKDQGQSSSCVGQGAATYSFVQNALELKPIYGSQLQSAVPELSAKSIYAPIALFTGGAFMGDAFKQIKHVGVNKEEDVPSYVDNQPLSESDMKDLSWVRSYETLKAQNYQLKEYRFIYERQSIDLIAQTIAECGGCLLGLFMDDLNSWMSPFPNVAQYRMYSHLGYGGKVKLINGKKYIGFLNSWGLDVGHFGWQWLPEEYFTSGMVHSAGAMIDKPNTTWVKFFDNNGKPRAFPTYMAKSIKYMLGRGSVLNPTYDV